MCSVENIVEALPIIKTTTTNSHSIRVFRLVDEYGEEYATIFSRYGDAAFNPSALERIRHR
jgi:hypothetical protein